MRTYLYAFLVLSLVLLGNIFGIEWHLYMRWYGYYDIFMHFLGGVGLGLFACAFLERSGPKWLRTKTGVVALVFIAGIVWEFFELYYGIAGAPFGTRLYWFDTVKDLIDDSLGAFLVVLIRARKWNRITSEVEVSQ